MLFSSEPLTCVEMWHTSSLVCYAADCTQEGAVVKTFTAFRFQSEMNYNSLDFIDNNQNAKCAAQYSRIKSCLRLLPYTEEVATAGGAACFIWHSFGPDAERPAAATLVEMC